MQNTHQAGLNWLTDSGIQAESGGLSRYYRADRGEYKPISSEITGYGIQAYLYLPPPGGPNLLSRATRAAQFLYDQANDGRTGVFPFEVHLNGSIPRQLAYFFDCGIVIRALLALWHATSDPAHLVRAERCGADLDKMSRVDGSFFPMLDLSSGLPFAGAGTWSLEPGVYQLKAGMAFLELAELTSSGVFSKTAQRLLDWCLRQHETFLPGSAEPERIADRLHAYCYFLEGLLPFLERHFECVQAFQSGITLVENLAGETQHVLERCDVIAQLLRLRLLGDYVGVSELDMHAASSEADRLLEFQLRTSDPRTDGAFAFGRAEGKLLPHANPATTIFALQALRMWQEHQSGEFRTTWRELI